MSRFALFILIAVVTFGVGLSLTKNIFPPFTIGTSSCMLDLPPPTREEIEESSRVGAKQDTIEDDIAEAVFRHMIQQHSEVGVYFLSRGNGTNPMAPSDAFVERLSGGHSRVKSVSRAFPTKSEFLDKKTGERGVVLDVYRIEWLVEEQEDWLNTTEFKIHTLFWPNGLEKEGTTYQVTKDGGRWVVR